MRCLLWFHSTNAALKTESTLKSALIPCAVIPTPAEITSECGISLLIEDQWIERARAVLGRAECTGCELIFPYEKKRTTETGR